MIINRIRRHTRLRKKVSGTAERPRLAVYRSLKGMYVQLIDDTKSVTLFGLHDSAIKSEKKLTKKERSYELGKLLGKEAAKKNITAVVFDRGGNAYHGRVEAFATGARESGLIF